MKKLLLAALLALPLTAPPLGTTAYAATCSGGANCRACKNCKYCKHCKGGGTCSVCRPDKYSATPEKGTPLKESTPPRAQRQSGRYISTPAQWSGQVVGVTDGDTLTVLYGSTPVRIRLSGIDAPESKQPYGARAKQALSQLAFGKTVSVYNEGHDRYGRVLARITAAGTDINSRMIADGMAWWYRQYSPERADLADLETVARAARRGLWSQTGAVAPWQWRRQK